MSRCTHARLSGCGGARKRTNAPLERGGKFVLFQIPLALRLTHVLQLKLVFLCERLAALCAKRRLPCRRPGESDDGREVDELVIERRAVVLDVTQRDAVRHHYQVFPFVGEAAERLSCVRVCREKGKRATVSDVRSTAHFDLDQKHLHFGSY
jgi:hypothetical protein